MTHLDAERLAAYLDRSLSAAEREAVEDHCAACTACRAELAAVHAIVATAPRRSRAPWVVLAAAAALAAVAVLPRGADAPRHRDPAVISTAAPVAVAPVGTAGERVTFVWTHVNGALAYELTVFDAGGQARWEATTSDTSAAAPADLVARLGAEGQGYWSVRARVGWNHWAASTLVPFTLPTDGGR